MLETVQSFSQFVGSLGTIGGFALAGAAFLVPRLRRLPQHLEEWVIAHRDERMAKAIRERELAALVGLLPEIRAEFRPNGGSSLRDRIDEAIDLAEQGVAEAVRVDGKLDRHIEASSRDRRDLRERLGRIEQGGSS